MTIFYLYFVVLKDFRPYFGSDVTRCPLDNNDGAVLITMGFPPTLLPSISIALGIHLMRWAGVTKI